MKFKFVRGSSDDNEAIDPQPLLCCFVDPNRILLKCLLLVIKVMMTNFIINHHRLQMLTILNDGR